VVSAVDVLAQWYLLNGVDPPAAGATLSAASDYYARIGTAAVLSAIVTLLATLLLSGLVTAVIGEAVLGRPVTTADAWRRLRPVFGRLVGVSFLVFLLWFAFALPGVALIVVAAAAGVPALLVLAVPLTLAGLVYAWVTFQFSPAAVVLERQTVRGALTRSRILTRRSWWRVFGVLLLALLIAGVISGIIGLPFNLAGGGLTTIGDDTGPVRFSELAISALGGLIASTLVRPFSAGVVALLYIDRRMRAEALDATLARAAAEAPRA
jgi:hypothetical protein